jgi:hypothetical protein
LLVGGPSKVGNFRGFLASHVCITTQNPESIRSGIRRKKTCGRVQGPTPQKTENNNAYSSMLFAFLSSHVRVVVLLVVKCLFAHSITHTIVNLAIVKHEANKEIPDPKQIIINRPLFFWSKRFRDAL